MVERRISFDDGAAYEQMMGAWSRLAGEVFLDWLAPPAGWWWIDVGCGNGAFTELLVERCSPTAVLGIDPSEAQLAYARGRPATRSVEFRQGDAMSLPCRDHSFDAAVMALVIFFVPDPPKGVAEMARVVRPGGLIASYTWDALGGGFPLEPFRIELGAMGVMLPMPPSSGASRMGALYKLWADAGLEMIETKAITVERTFANFDELWTISRLAATAGQTIDAMAAEDIERLKARLRTRLAADSAGRITYAARANAIKGRRSR
jgi:SAM-dependent methyltransferase